MGDCFYCSKAEPVVQTKAGKIRGFIIILHTLSMASSMLMLIAFKCPER